MLGEAASFDGHSGEVLEGNASRFREELAAALVVAAERRQLAMQVEDRLMGDARCAEEDVEPTHRLLAFRHPDTARWLE